jgi:hypothetical protein
VRQRPQLARGRQRRCPRVSVPQDVNGFGRVGACDSQEGGGTPFEEAVAATRSALETGASLHLSSRAHPRTTGAGTHRACALPSKLGDFSYEVMRAIGER